MNGFNRRQGKLQMAFGIVTRGASREGVLPRFKRKDGGNDSTSPHSSVAKAPFVSVSVC